MTTERSPRGSCPRNGASGLVDESIGAGGYSTVVTPVRVVVAILGAAATALMIGIPTGIVQTDLYHRMTPVLWWNYPAWVVTSILTGALVGTYVDAKALSQRAGMTFGGSLLSFFAVGCPICNKIVVLALGVSGAMTWFAPIQPVLALGSLGLLAYALRARVRGLVSCPIPNGSGSV